MNFRMGRQTHIFLSTEGGIKIDHFTTTYPCSTKGAVLHGGMHVWAEACSSLLNVGSQLKRIGALFSLSRGISDYPSSLCIHSYHTMPHTTFADPPCFLVVEIEHVEFC